MAKAAKPASSKAVATVGAQPASNVLVMEEIPDYMKASGPAKLDSNFDASDMVRPSIKLLQATSPQIKDFKGVALPGMLWHTGSNQSLGDEVIFVIAAARKKYILYAPRGSAQAVLARADNGQTWDKPNTKFDYTLKSGKKVVYNTKASVQASGLAEFGSSDPDNPDSQPAATCHYEFLVFLPHAPELGPTILSLARSQLSPGKRLVTNFETRGRMSDIFGCAFRAAIVEDTNAAGEDFYNFQFSNAGFVGKEFRDMVAAAADRFRDFRAADEEYAQGDAKSDVSEIKRF